MSIQTWRIVRARRAATAFSGDGARLFGGRWNSRGVGVVYTSGSMALAMLELLVHVEPHELTQRHVMFPVAIDGALISRVDPARLPRSWRRSPPPRAIQQIGDDWVARGTSAVLQVPSAVVPGEFNYVLNPAHPDYAKVRVGAKRPVQFDARLLERGAV